MSMGIGEAGTNLIGAALGLQGKKPKVPSAPHVDPEAEASQSIKDNLANLPGLEELTSKINAFSTSELLKSYEKMMPGYASLLKEGSDTIGQLMKGELPGLDDYIKRRGAEFSTATGTSGSSFGFGEEAGIGFEAKHKLIGEGLTAFERWSQMAKGPQFDFTQFLLTPGQRIATQQWNEQSRFGQEWMANRIAAMPSPLEQAEQGALNSFGAMVDQYGSMALAGMGGAGGAAFDGSGGASMFGGGGGASTGSAGTAPNYDIKSSVPSYTGLDYRYNSQTAFYPTSFQ